ncbi:acyl-CoA desaturase 1 [Tetranychus urticae]|uniref:Fatty acid desaturase domain-containing protein n=1 Tax=Tetranychus urticae TaxID=32264 RepID=T1KC69_TETUR|nr:acyl-CoA desaturase 1 [Tetranychus urticae]
MTPRNNESEDSLLGDSIDDNLKLKITSKDPNWKPLNNIVWRNVIWYLLLHIGAIYGFSLAYVQAKWFTLVYALILGQVSFIGVTGGAHRLWSHRSYKATFPFRLFLIICNTICGQNSIYDWCRDHRVHHKYSETDADPHNSNRGFFFSHMGWLLCRKHPLVIACGRKIDLSDLLEDPLVVFQREHYLKLFFILGFIVPALIPTLIWSESLWTSFWVCSVARYCSQLHRTWLVNSAAHMWGYRPYDKSIASAENAIVSCLTLGEGHHNYHHTFPWDYSTSEWGWSLNVTTMVIDLAQKVGFVHDCKTVPKEFVNSRCNRTGIKRE